MVYNGRGMNTYIASIICTLLLIVIIPLCHSIRLEYRPSLGQVFTYSEVTVSEVTDADEDIDYSIERSEKIYTERILHIDESDNGMITVEINFNSVELTPPNERKKNKLLGIRERFKINRQGTMQSTLVSAILGDVDNVFPSHDIDVGKSWATTINGLAKANTRYTLVNIDQDQVATIEMECSISVFEDLGTATMSGTWKIDLETGITLEQEQTSIKQVFSKRTVKTKTKRLIARE